jgi:hypothetical protein
VRLLGPFDLDPCFGEPRPWATAAVHYGERGLDRPWRGMVWCNPPYDDEAGRWLARCAEHGAALALVFARTETAWWQSEVWAKASAVLFLAGRLHFHHADGQRAAHNGGAPSALIAYGAEAARRLHDSGVDGPLITAWLTLDARV